MVDNPNVPWGETVYPVVKSVTLLLPDLVLQRQLHLGQELPQSSVYIGSIDQ